MQEQADDEWVTNTRKRLREAHERRQEEEHEEVAKIIREAELKQIAADDAVRQSCPHYYDDLAAIKTFVRDAVQQTQLDEFVWVMLSVKQALVCVTYPDPAGPRWCPQCRAGPPSRPGTGRHGSG